MKRIGTRASIRGYEDLVSREREHKSPHMKKKLKLLEDQDAPVYNLKVRKAIDLAEKRDPRTPFYWKLTDVIEKIKDYVGNKELLPPGNSFMDQIVVNTNNVNKIMNEAKAKRKKREIYKIINRKESMFGGRLFSKNKQPGVTHRLKEAVTPKKDLDLERNSKVLSMPPDYKTNESQDKTRPKISQMNMSKSRTILTNSRNTESIFDPKSLRKIRMLNKGLPQRNFHLTNQNLVTNRTRTSEKKTRDKKSLVETFRSIRKKLRINAPLTKASGKSQVYFNKATKNRDIQKVEILSHKLDSRYQQLLRSKYRHLESRESVRRDVLGFQNRNLTSRAQSCIPISQRATKVESAKIKKKMRKKCRRNLSQPSMTREQQTIGLDYSKHMI
ncbi:unnamed protein product [Moneuplotes crassus]|uniref:Uncharacterized protein n=1 Tax=Euplotes crassus TaxID=5936 RepID=A0AAD1UKA5_EUPCR|nr:unnamed protein product [Moneuplotes crassus]